MTSPYRTAAPTPEPEPEEPLVTASNSQILTNKVLAAPQTKSMEILATHYVTRVGLVLTVTTDDYAPNPGDLLVHERSLGVVMIMAVEIFATLGSRPPRPGTRVGLLLSENADPAAFLVGDRVRIQPNTKAEKPKPGV